MSLTKINARSVSELGSKHMSPILRKTQMSLSHVFIYDQSPNDQVLTANPYNPYWYESSTKGFSWLISKKNTDVSQWDQSPNHYLQLGKTSLNVLNCCKRKPNLGFLEQSLDVPAVVMTKAQMSPIIVSKSQFSFVGIKVWVSLVMTRAQMSPLRFELNKISSEFRFPQLG